ncbi:MAG: hypothetical protein KDD42_08225, partial [Bdellovibrionales bacterium]|nr:hypothetical protein [Bdellovibrionales bacterium]
MFSTEFCLAEYRLGVSAFGIQSKHFQGKPCKNLLSIVLDSDRPALAFLYKTFGDDNRCLKQYWDGAKAQAKRHLTEIHFSNESGRRKNFVDKMDFVAEVDTKTYNKLLEQMPEWLEVEIVERVNEIEALIAPYVDDGDFLLSTGLEDNYSPRAWENLYHVISAEWPYAIVRNRRLPRSNWVAPTGVYEEYHHYNQREPQSPLCVLNGDGQDLDFLSGGANRFGRHAPASLEDLLDWLEKGREYGCLTFLWAGKWQGFFEGEVVPKPLARKFSVDRSDVRLIRLLHREEPDAIR